MSVFDLHKPLLQFLFFGFLLYPIVRIFVLDQPLGIIIPNLLLFTSYRNLTHTLWQRVIQIDENIRYKPSEIPEIQANDYTFDRLRLATNNWRIPAVVRGLFNNSAAMTKWLDLDYLPSRIGEYRFSVVRRATVGDPPNERILMAFKDSFREIMTNKTSKMYLFFPVRAKVNVAVLENTYRNYDKKYESWAHLKQAVDEIIYEDLELSRIRPNFGNPKVHTNYIGAQFVIGQGNANESITTGSGYHCAAGNNYFVQVMGRKRWYFLSPEYSAYLWPLRIGMPAFQVGRENMPYYQQFLPTKYVDLGPGDMLYNPDFQWHAIQNYEGLSIGLPIREFNFSLTLRNNPVYAGIAAVNKLADRFGIDIGGYPKTVFYQED